MHVLLELFITFFKIGLFTFGGGYAMIPLVTEEVISHAWLSSEQIINFIAVAESTPGPIAINMATFVGSTQYGVLGAICATLGIVLPSFIIILVIVSLITGLMKFAGVKAFLSGVRPVVVGLIVGTAVTLFLTVVLSLSRIANAVIFDWKALVIFMVVFLSNFIKKKITKKGLSPILIILSSAILGIIFYGLI